MLLGISQNLLEFLFIKVEVVPSATLAKNENPAEACEFCEIFKNIFYYSRTPQGNAWFFSISKEFSHYGFLSVASTLFNETLLKNIFEDISVVGKKFVVQRHLSNFQKQPPELVCQKQLTGNFTKFTGKHLCFATLFKGSNTGVFL